MSPSTEHGNGVDGPIDGHSTPTPPWTIERGHDPVLATAIHAGYRLREEVATVFRLPEHDRLREEDPFTDRWVGVAANSIVVHRSRFEVDLNRPRDKAVYRRPEDAWGLDMWHVELSDGLVTRSLDLYDAFYHELGRIFDELVEVHGRFVVLDIHSYNHRRTGPEGPAEDPDANPEINLGTESVDGAEWEPVLDAFARGLTRIPLDDRPVDVRSNVRFRGGNMARWINARYGSRGCAIAVEMKKIFMDEWTGQVDEHRTATIGRILESGAAEVREALAESSPR
jgi:N-formylglutamate amidohydrolase